MLLDMSAKKNQSILNFFSRKPSLGASPQTKPTKVENAVTKPIETTEKGDEKLDDSISKSQEEIDLDELAKSCLEDDDDGGMEVSEPIVEKKKRKRISMLDDSSDEEENVTKKEVETPNKRLKLNETSDNKPFSMSTPKSAKKIKEKENSSPPSSSSKSSNKVLKDKLSMFASPNLNNSKSEAKYEKPKEEENEQQEYVTKAHMSYPFLKPDKIMDKNKRRPDDPDYDPGTLYVPRAFFEEQSPGQQQWWNFKSNHYDKVLFFKMGKFYELFHMGEFNLIIYFTLERQKVAKLMIVLTNVFDLFRRNDWCRKVWFTLHGKQRCGTLWIS